MKTPRFVFLFAPLLLLSMQCGKGFKVPDGAIYIPPGGWEIKIPDDPKDPPSPQECNGPKPPNIGCTIVCKPCITFYCKNGEWTRFDIEWPEGQCSSTGSPDNPQNVCPRTPEGFCPAECSWCF